MLRTKIVGTALCALMVASSAHARLVQILHTNDTHSYMDGATHETNVGGSARLSALISFYKDKGEKEGVPTITMDAGDFLEGNIFYMADKGMKSFEVHNNVGYDVVSLGNHDYMMGAKELDIMLGKIDLNFSFLAANVWVSPKFENIRSKIQPYREIEIDGIKIAILGLTTNEFYYSWSLEDSQITDPYQSALTYEDILKKRKNDFVIALTHMGVGKDHKLAKKTSNIDLIVGGHSHTAIFAPEYEKNKAKKMVPIVQAGMHTEYLGKIILDLEKGKPLKIVSYELVPVKYQAENTVVKNIVEDANVDLGNTYGEEWLNEKIGQSDLIADDPSGSRKWAYYISDALREKSSADVAIHAPPMNGENFPVGAITRRSIINSIPRVFNLEDTYGWSIYTAKVKGIWLKTVFETLASFGEPLAYSGIEMKFVKTPFGVKIGHAYINGKPINPLKNYKVAFTEGIIKGAREISPKTLLLLQHPEKTPYKIWQTLQEKVIHDGRQFNGLTNNISENNRTFYLPSELEK
ncbi:MAG: bifunctional metallophosphatase/5'-nucleotidase [Bacteriovorax sp.]|nr:bifunctional metallophosphatase/5'-nucleotidase [Bacteriovorax sp.]